jgi:mRNA interferase MazF
MKQAGQVVLFRFPQTDLGEGKPRPALLLGKLPGKYDDWLICMIFGQTCQYIDQFDEVIREDDEDFDASGLKKESVIAWITSCTNNPFYDPSFSRNFLLLALQLLATNAQSALNV